MAINPIKPTPRKLTEAEAAKLARDEALRIQRFNMNKQWFKLIAAGVGSIGLLNTLQNRPTPHTEHTVSSPATPDDLNPSGREDVRNNLTFVDRVQSERPERVEVAAPPEKIGTLIDVKAEDLAKWRLDMHREGDNLIVSGLPMHAQDSTRLTEYRMGEVDPLQCLPADANPKIVEEALDRWKKVYRSQGHVDSTDIAPDTGYRNLDMEVPNYQANNAARQAARLAQITKDQKVVLRIDLGSISGPMYAMLKELLTAKEKLSKDIESKLFPGTPYLRFLTDAVTSPKTGEFDINGFQSLQSLFSLSDPDRKIFFDAISNNDLFRAREILLFRSADTPFTEDLIYSLNDYIRRLKDSTVEKGKVAPKTRKALEKSYYNLKINSERPVHDPVDSALVEAFTAEQMDSLRRIPDYVLDAVIADSLSSDQTVNLAKLRPLLDDVMSSSGKYAIHTTGFDILPLHTVQAIQNNLSKLSGRNGVSSWLDDTDRENNFVSMLNLFKLRAEMKADTPDKKNKDTLLDHIACTEDGKAYMLLEFSAESPDLQLNRGRIFHALSILFQSLSHPHPLLVRNIGQERYTLPLRERIIGHFAHDSFDPALILETVISPFQIESLLGVVPPPSHDLIDALTTRDEKKPSIVLASPQTPAENFTVCDIERMRGQDKGQGSRGTSIGAEVHLPSQGASAANAR